MISLRSLSPFVRISGDRLRASYTGQGLHEADVGIVQADVGTATHHYFEVTLLDEEVGEDNILLIDYDESLVATESFLDQWRTTFAPK